MTEAPHRVLAKVLRWEGLLVTLAAAAAFASIPLLLGQIGLSWDALNHHFYLGWTAERPRFERDYMAASYQAYQYPYLYWPAYKLGMAGFDGAAAGALLALLPVTAVPAVWLMARTCMPGRDAFALGMRVVAVALAFASGVVLSMLDSTANDLLAGVPLVWAVALALQPLGERAPSLAVLPRSVWLAGLLAGVSVAFKFSNGPLVVMLPVLWLLAPAPLGTRLLRGVFGGMFAILGCVLAYGYWGWLLWQQFGNPMYPLYDGYFEGLRAATGWSR